MPELPEVETIARGLRERIIGRELERIESYREGTIRSDRTQCSGTVERIDRRGKYILIRLSSETTITVHLGMTGKLVFADSLPKDNPHLRASIHFRDGSLVLFIDPRTFGYLFVGLTGSDINGVGNLGPEPLSKSFDRKHLRAIFSKRKAPVKNLLMNQQLIAGLGNIYACEALFHSGIHPERPAYSLTDAEIGKLVKAIRDVLNEALEKNGTSISDFRSVEDKTGEFQDFLRVYGKKSCKCGTGIQRIRQAGRSTYFCPKCQK